ncbi:MAG: hypothetical protein ACLFQM_10800 [Fidelibacterota bacterium]
MKFIKDDKKVLWTITLATLIFLFLRSFGLPFRDGGGRPLIVIIRLVVYLPLLIFTARGHKFAGQVFSWLFLLNFLAGFAGLFYRAEILSGWNGLVFLVMMVCLGFNAYNLFLNKSFRQYLAAKGD